MKQQVKRAVLAYSGGLGSSIIIPWLKENYGCEVIAVVADIGQEEEVSCIKEKALKCGASKVFVENLRSEFVSEFLWPLVKSGAAYEGSYLLGTAIACPLIAKHQVKIAVLEGADALVHGCVAAGNDETRFEFTYNVFAPQLKVIAPRREWEIRSRSEALSYALARNISTEVREEKLYSHDSNLWHSSHEGGILENSEAAVPEDLFERTLDPSAAPDGESEITIDFDKGIPVGLNGKSIPPVQIIEDLNEIGGTNCIGRVDMVESQIAGGKSRGVYETPGGTLIMTARNQLESLVLDRRTRYQKDMLSVTYAQLVYDGQWFTPLREALDAFFSKVSDIVTGSVTLILYKGNLAVKSRRSPHRLPAAGQAQS